MPTPARPAPAIAAAFLAAALACEPGATRDHASAAPAHSSRPAPDAATLIPAQGEIPLGGLADWIADVRTGLADLPSRVTADPAAAQRRALEHYAGRQEYIEIFYGTRGRLTAGETLGPAVMSAEARFHDLLRLLAGSPPPDSARVRAAIAALDAEYDRVLEEAIRAGVPMDPHTADGAAAR